MSAHLYDEEPRLYVSSALGIMSPANVVAPAIFSALPEIVPQTCNVDCVVTVPIPTFPPSITMPFDESLSTNKYNNLADS